MGLGTTAGSLTPFSVGVDPGAATHAQSIRPSIGPRMRHPGGKAAAVLGDETDSRAKASWIGDRSGRPVQVNDTSALAEFRTAPGLKFIGLVAGAVGIIGFSHMSFWAAAAALGLLALACVDFLQLRRNPILSIYSSFLEIRPRGMWGRTHRISFAELGGWRQGSRFLCFETTASRKVSVRLQVFSRADRSRLIAQLESLKLGQPGFPGPTDADLVRQEWKARALLIGVVIALYLILALSRWLGIH